MQQRSCAGMEPGIIIKKKDANTYPFYIIRAYTDSG